MTPKRRRELDRNKRKRVERERAAAEARIRHNDAVRESGMSEGMYALSVLLGINPNRAAESARGGEGR